MRGFHCIMNKAATSGNLELVKYLLDQGVCIHEHHDMISFAARSGNLEMVKFLVSNGINNSKRHDFIWLTATSGNITLVKYLVSQGFNAYAYEGFALTKNGVAKEDTHMSKSLISTDADINIYYNRMVSAVENGDVFFESSRGEKRKRNTME